MLFGAIGYAAAFCGFAAGTGLTLFVGKSGVDARRVLVGFAAGILIAFVCFTMLPQVFFTHGVMVGSLGITLGVLSAVWLETKVGGGIFIAGIILHGLPEGIALGSIMQHNFTAGMYMAMALSVHCLPESLTFSSYMRRNGFGRIGIFMTTFVLAAPVGIGAALGGALQGIPVAVSSMCMAFAGGVMLYLACGEVLPEANDRRHGLLTIIAAGVGFTIGVWLTSTLI